VHQCAPSSLETTSRRTDMKRSIAVIAAAGFVAAGALAAPATPSDQTAPIARGRYLVQISGCNDCHTPGYPESGGKTAEADWLVGSPVGFQGPWGTTYPANLRLVVDRMTEAQFLARARSEMRPPMPWFNLRAMTDDDLRAMYRYLRSLGAKGAPAPSYAAPNQRVATPYIVFVPQNLPQKTASR
jgi:mono/diheme cytochrome c family protein